MLIAVRVSIEPLCPCVLRNRPLACLVSVSVNELTDSDSHTKVVPQPQYPRPEGKQQIQHCPRQRFRFQLLFFHRCPIDPLSGSESREVKLMTSGDTEMRVILKESKVIVWWQP